MLELIEVQQDVVENVRSLLVGRRLRVVIITAQATCQRWIVSDRDSTLDGIQDFGLFGAKECQIAISTDFFTLILRARRVCAVFNNPEVILRRNFL